MLTSRMSIFRQSAVREIFGNQGFVYFWWSRFLPRWLPLVLGLGLGVISAKLIASGAWYFAAPLAVIIPLAILFNRYPFIIVLLWLLIVPYIIDSPSVAAYYLYWLLYRVAPPVVLILAIIANGLRTRTTERVPLGWAEGILLFGVVIAFLNATYLFDIRVGYEFSQRLFRVYDRLFIPISLYWVIRLTAPSQKDLRWLLVVAFITLVGQAFIGIVSWFAPQMLPPEWLDLQGARTVGSLGNVAVYTSTLMFCGLLLFQSGMNTQSKKLRLLLISAFALAFYCLFMSFSRGSWLGGVCILLILLVIYHKTMIRLTIILGIVIYALSGTLLAGQVAWGYERLTGEDAEKSANSRVTANGASVSMIKAKPFFGWGSGNYDLFKRPYMKRIGNYAVHNETSHNTYLTLMVEYGLVFFSMYMFPVVWWLVLSIKNWRRFPKTGFWSWRLLVLLWAVVLHTFIVTNFMDMFRFFPFGTAIWWMALGLIGNFVQRYVKSPEVDSKPQVNSTVALGYPL